MTYIIKKGSIDKQTLGTWWFVKRDGKPIVKVKCPGCEGVSHLSQEVGHHHIFKTGEVQPSLDCDYDNCDFHKHVWLEDWKP